MARREPAGTRLAAPQGGRRWRRGLVALYLLGVAGDLAWHVQLYLATGDRQIEAYEWIVSLQASLFWPLDLIARALLALR